MKFEKINNKGQAQLFSNSYLEMLTKTHPLVIWGLYLPLAAGLLYYSFVKLGNPPWKILVFFSAGMLFWIWLCNP